MKLSVIKLTAFASLATLSVAQYNTQCDDQNSPAYTSVINCISAINSNTIAACTTADGGYDGDPCDCAQELSTYACATSVCGASAELAIWYAPIHTQCGTPAVSASYATTIYPSGYVSAANTEQPSASASSIGKASTTAATTSNPTASVASQTSSAQAGGVRGSTEVEVVVAVLVGVAGALI